MCPRGELEHVKRGNFPESGKLHVARIQDRLLVFKYSEGVYVRVPLGNLMHAALTCTNLRAIPVWPRYSGTRLIARFGAGRHFLSSGAHDG